MVQNVFIIHMLYGIWRSNVFSEKFESSSNILFKQTYFHILFLPPEIQIYRKKLPLTFPLAGA